MEEVVKKADSGIKLLLVDDESDFIALLSAGLRPKGYSIITARNSAEAFERIKKDAPDALFLDVLLGNEDGFSVLKQIRQFNKTIPVIMMSSYIEDTRAEKTLNPYGFSGIFCKSEDFSQAEILLHKALKK